jgi:hypothetical protein
MPTTAASMRASYPGLFSSTTVFATTYLNERIAEAALRTIAASWPSTAWYDLAILYKASELALRGVRQFSVGSAGGSGGVQSMTTIVGSVSYELKSSSPKALADAFAMEFDNLARLTAPPIAVSG